MIRPLKAPGRSSESPHMVRAAALLALCAFLAPAPAAAEIYRWTDEQGNERFSDRIENVPEAYRTDVSDDLRRDPAPAPVPPAGAAPLAAQEPPAAPPADLPEMTRPELPDWSAQLLGLGVGVAIAAALVGIAVGLLFLALALRLACRIVGEDVPGWGRAVGVSAVQMVASIVVGAVLAGVALLGLVDLASTAFQGVQILLNLGVNALVIQAMLAQRFGRALAVAVVALLVTVVVAVVVGVGIAIVVGGLVAG